MRVGFILSVFLLLRVFDAGAQTNKLNADTLVYKDFIRTKAKEPSDFSAYILRNMIYPGDALKNKKEGKVVIELVVEKDGTTSNARILKGKEIGNGIPEEALRLIAASPKWTAATVNGTPVRSYYIIPIKFSLPQKGMVAEKVSEASPSRGMNTPDKKINNDNEIYRTLHVSPKPPPDQNGYFARNLRYPEKARENKIQGRVVVEFVVERDGSITNVRVIQGAELGHGIPEEATRVVKAMPKWQPGILEGKTVRAYYMMPVSFKLQ